MANNRTITSANAVLMIGVSGLYDTPRRIQGFSSDDVSDIDTQSIAETMMGVDGRLSAGFVFTPTVQNVVLQADSESNDVFEHWQQAERQRSEKYIAFGSILILATGQRYSLQRGYLTNVSVIPALRKTLQPRRFTITWERVTPGPA